VYHAAVSQRRALLWRVAGVAIALFLISLFLAFSGHSPLSLGAAVLKAAVGSSYGLQQALILATPIILTGIGVSVSMRMGVWNVGAEGQLFLGAFFATLVGLNLHLPRLPGLALMLLAGALGGALWALLPALMKAYAEVNEIITTLLFNFVAVLLVRHVVNGSMRDRSLGELFASPRVPFELPKLFGAYLHIGILIAIVLAVLVGLLLKYSRWGYEVAIIGGNRRAAEFAGIRVISQTFVVFLLSGAIAGIAGMIEVAGTAHRLSAALSPGYGYLGLIAAVLAANSPIGIILVGVLYAALLNAGIVLQAQGLSTHFVLVITGSILLFATIGEMAAHFHLVPVRAGPEPCENVDEAVTYPAQLAQQELDAPAEKRPPGIAESETGPQQAKADR
jgi:simple sugar transport system permease protein